MGAAERAGIPFSLSRVGTRSIEKVRDAAPDAERWFQLHLWWDQAASLDLLQRAKAAGMRPFSSRWTRPCPGSCCGTCATAWSSRRA